MFYDNLTWLIFESKFLSYEKSSKRKVQWHGKIINFSYARNDFIGITVYRLDKP